MRASALKYSVVTFLSTIILSIMFLVPFHAFLTVWLSTAIGSYDALRLWKEGLLLLSVIGASYLILTDSKIRSHTLTRKLAWSIALYGVLFFSFGIFALIQNRVNNESLVYSLVTNLRYLAFFLIAWAVALRTSKLHKSWQKVIIVPLIVVILFALIQQLFLPPRFLENFGYSKFTILPFQYVDNNPEFLRVQSTLRGANPLGAYLLLGLSIVLVKVFTGERGRNKFRLTALFVSGLAALYFTYSRSAWVGALLSMGIIFSQLPHPKLATYKKVLFPLTLVTIAILGFLLGRSEYVQNAILHTSESSKSQVTSNEVRYDSIVQAADDIVDEPLGRGPGTAGPASVHNDPYDARISENYYLQIGQEVGLIGMTLFLIINIGVGYLLWLRRADPLALSLFASLIGLTFVNLLSHGWADDTLAYIWWGLAGIAMVSHKNEN